MRQHLTIPVGTRTPWPGWDVLDIWEFVLPVPNQLNVRYILQSESSWSDPSLLCQRRQACNPLR